MALYSARKGFNVGLTVGGINLNRGFHIIAGPCSVESAEQINAAATVLAGHGVRILRGGAFKPRTSPYSFQGLADKGEGDSAAVLVALVLAEKQIQAAARS